MKYVLFLSFACLISCKAQKEAKPNAGETNGMELIASDAYSGIETYETSVVTDAKSLQKFYSRINKTRKPGLPMPIVDFSKEMLLVLCLGEQKGKSAPLLKKSEKEDKVLITIKLSDKNIDVQDAPLPISHPFYIYKISHTSKTVDIQKDF